VFLANDEASAVTGAALARIAGYENVAALEGGLSGFMRTIVSMDGGANPAVDRETLEFRTRAGHQIAAMIRQRSAPKPVKAVRRVQGGCGG
jgi:hypothetical protein